MMIVLDCEKKVKSIENLFTSLVDEIERVASATINAYLSMQSGSKKLEKVCGRKSFILFKIELK